jgi:hypothetical protein
MCCFYTSHAPEGFAGWVATPRSVTVNFNVLASHQAFYRYHSRKEHDTESLAYWIQPMLQGPNFPIHLSGITMLPHSGTKKAFTEFGPLVSFVDVHGVARVFHGVL